MLLLETKDPRLANINVVHVVVSPDLRLARVYVGAPGTVEEAKGAIKGLEHAAGYLRSQIAQRLQLRCAPELAFELDESWKRGARIDELLNQLRSTGTVDAGADPGTASDPGLDDRDTEN